LVKSPDTSNLLLEKSCQQQQQQHFVLHSVMMATTTTNDASRMNTLIHMTKPLKHYSTTTLRLSSPCDIDDDELEISGGGDSTDNSILTLRYQSEPTISSVSVRVQYNVSYNTLLCNFDYMHITSREHVQNIKQVIQELLDKHCAKKVHCFTNYDGFEVDDDLMEYYTEHVVRFFVDNYYASVQRYTTKNYLHDAIQRLEIQLKEKCLELRYNNFSTNPLIGGRYLVDDQIGEGSFGVVKLAIDGQTGQRVAIKQLDLVKIKLSGSEYIEFLEREEQIMKQVADHKNCHKNICALYNYIKEDDFVYIVMEYCENGPLETDFNEHEQFEEDKARHYFRQIIYGIEYLHEHNVMHRDLQLQNICTTATDQIKICDFSLSDWFTHGEKKHQQLLGHIQYAHPAMLRQDCYGSEVDVWSAGVCLYKMLTGYLPFRRTEHALIGQFSIPLDQEESLSDECKQLITCILNPVEEKRYDLKQIKEHPWFI
jgi:hypothetical protein